MKKFYSLSLIILLFVCFFLYNQNCEAQWIKTSGAIPGGIASLTYNSSYIFAGTSINGVYRSSNNGQSWTQTALNALDIYALAINSGTLFAGTDTCIYMSTNNGQSWTHPTIQYGSGTTRSFAVSGSYIYAADDNGVDRSTNNGLNWISSTYHNNGRVVAANGQYVFVGDNNSFVYRSTNYGQNWSQSPLNQTYYIGSMAINGNNIFVGTGGNGVYRSTNNGLNWTQTSLNNKLVNALAVTGNNIIAGADYDGVYVSNDNGQSWTLRNEGFYAEVMQINALMIANGNVYLGGHRSGQNFDSLWMRPLSQIIGIKKISSNVPARYSLYQNYPNPFNPSTVIKFDVAHSDNRNDFVTLKVYNIIGKEIATMVNDKLEEGIYEIPFNSEQLSGGVYFYRLTVNGFSETKKMVVVK